MLNIWDLGAFPTSSWKSGCEASRWGAKPDDKLGRLEENTPGMRCRKDFMVNLTFGPNFQGQYWGSLITNQGVKSVQGSKSRDVRSQDTNEWLKLMQHLFSYPLELSALRMSVWKEHWTSVAVLLSQLCLDPAHSFIFYFLFCKIKELDKDVLLRVFQLWHSRILLVSLNFIDFAAKYIRHIFPLHHLLYFSIYGDILRASKATSLCTE